MSAVSAPSLKYLVQKGRLVGVEIDTERKFIPWDVSGYAVLSSS